MRTTVRVHMNTGDINLQHLIDEDTRSREKHIKPDPATGHTFERLDGHTYTDLQGAYEEIFGDMLKEYNKKQKNKDRKLTIEQFMSKMESDKRGAEHKVKFKRADGSTGYRLERREKRRLIYEMTVSAGNSEYDGYDSTKHKRYTERVPEEVNKAACLRYQQGFEERNPALRIGFAAWHGDEGYESEKKVWEYGTGHLQFGFIPAASYSKGLPLRASIGAALEQCGYKSYEAFQASEQAIFEQILQEEYNTYCEQNPLYRAYNGDLEIYHPISDGSRNPDSVSPAVYAREKQVAERERLADEKEQANAEMSRRLNKRKSVVMKREDAANAKELTLQAQETALQEQQRRLQAQETALQQQQIDIDTRRKQLDQAEADYQHKEDKLEAQKRVQDAKDKEQAARDKELHDREERVSEREKILFTEPEPVATNLLGKPKITVEQVQQLQMDKKALQNIVDRQKIYTGAEAKEKQANAMMSAAKRTQKQADAALCDAQQMKSDVQQEIQQKVDAVIAAADTRGDVEGFRNQQMQKFIDADPGRKQRFAIWYRQANAERMERLQNDVAQMGAVDDDITLQADSPQFP